MFVRLLAFLLIATPLFATDYDTLFYGDIEDAPIRWDSVMIYNTSYRNFGGAVDIDLVETPILKKRALFRFSTTGLDKVPDTNAVTSAKLRVNTTLFSVPYYLKIYAMTNDANWVEGAATGLSPLQYGHGGVSWMSPAQPNYPDTATGTLPASFDWRDSNLTTTVKNQGFCGSCWAHALISQIESAHKKDVINWTVVENSEDNAGADRNIEPLLTPSPEVTATGAEGRTLPVWLINKWYRTTGTDNGLIFIPDSGDIIINTSENASNKPVINLDCVTIDKTTQAYSENVKIRITGADLFDSYINSAAPTTNYGTATTAPINATNRYVMRVDSLRRIVDAALSAANDTLVSVTAAYCTLYVATKNSNASIGAYKLLKSKFIEDSVTYNLYRGDKEWGTAGANLTDQLDLSEQQLISCIPGTDCINGGALQPGMYYLRDGDSILTEDAFGYSGAGNSDDTPCPDTFGTANALKVGWIWRMPGATERILKQALLIQPLTVAHYINASFLGYAYSTSNTCWYGSGAEDSSHAVELIGYDDNFVCDLDGGTGAWIIKNQYGSGWGQDGYAYVSKNGHTDMLAKQSNNSTNAFFVISVTEQVPRWTAGGVTGGSEVAGLVAVTPDIGANGWQDIEIPAWVIRAMINGKMSRTLLIQAETEPSEIVGFGVKFSSTESTASGSAPNYDRPYLVLKSVPESQFQLKIGNAKIGNSSIGR